RCVCVYFFFFSSRRRHTRFSRDWSSDVCSSDLCVLPVLSLKALGLAQSGESRERARAHALWYTAGVLVAFAAVGALVVALRAAEIGRASCRERGEISVGAGARKRRIETSGRRVG